MRLQSSRVGLVIQRVGRRNFYKFRYDKFRYQKFGYDKKRDEFRIIGT